MDYKEEQAQEIEILQSIYPDELSVESETRFTIDLKLETVSDRKHKLVLHVEYPESYPEVVPVLDVSVGDFDDDDDDDGDDDGYGDDESEEDSDDGEHKPVIIAEVIEFDNEDLEYFKEQLAQEAEDQVGMPSVFALASSLKDLAEQKFEEKLEIRQKQYDEELLAKEREEQKKFYGTKVTRDNFNEWRLKFRKEMGIEERDEQRKKEIHGGKLSGKEIFERGLANDDDVEELTSGVKELSTEA